ncbi:hypothetical protein CPC08DRAFT_699100 [Agrocybe pediades]|nr:hypothetical protein CPC08DRAFT_699100 [Agrocybe pediades]
MNIALEQTEEHVNGRVTNRYGDTFVKGNNVLYTSAEEPLEIQKLTPESSLSLLSLFCHMNYQLSNCSMYLFQGPLRAAAIVFVPNTIQWMTVRDLPSNEQSPPQLGLRLVHSTRSSRLQD